MHFIFIISLAVVLAFILFHLHTSCHLRQTQTKQHRKVTQKNILKQKSQIIIKRKCPICSMQLARDEALYGNTIENGAILIHGCPYCYKGQFLPKNYSVPPKVKSESPSSS